MKPRRVRQHPRGMANPDERADIVEGTGNKPARPGEGFPDRLMEWLAAYGDLVTGLSALRDLGDQELDAVAAVLQVRPIQILKASWGMWDVMGNPEESPLELLLESVPLPVVERLTYALWGNGVRAVALLDWEPRE